MNLEELEQSGLIFYRTIVGSHAYGTNTPTSDIDVKGFFWVDPSEYLSLNPPVTPQTGQINDEKHDTTFYSLYRAFELLQTANPNMIELLWMPDDCILNTNEDIMRPLLENRNLFISKQAYHSHAEYARNQIKKARGKNKKVHKGGVYQKGLNKLSELLKKGEISDEWIQTRFSETILVQVRKLAGLS